MPEPKLEISRCPQCYVSKPNLNLVHHMQTQHNSGKPSYLWEVYFWTSCFNLVMRRTRQDEGVHNRLIFPRQIEFDQSIPDEARNDLIDAQETLHSPAASIIMSSRAVDTMFQLKGYKQKYLNDKIIAAAKDNLITDDMKEWAHKVRLDANGQRHKDLSEPKAEIEDANRTLEFAKTIAQLLFVLPARVKEGIKEKKENI